MLDWRYVWWSQHIQGASKSQQDFDSEVKSASVELDHWRSEAVAWKQKDADLDSLMCQAQELAGSIEELDEQKKVRELLPHNLSKTLSTN